VRNAVVVRRLLCIWHAIPFAALAEEPPSSLERVVVTATRSERTLADVPASVTVISREEIAATPAQSVDEVLRVAGVEMTLVSSYQAHPTSALISMRGLKSGVTSHVLVMVDGVPINDGFSGFVQWNRVPLENIERIEIVRGGGASLWGTYALGGVINIITRAPAASTVQVEAGYGTFDTYRAYGYGALAAGDNAHVSLAASRWGTGGFNQVAPQWRNDSTIWDKTSFDASNVQLGGRFTPAPGVSVQAHVNYHTNDQTLLTPVDSNTHRIWNGDVAVNWRLGSGSSLSATLFHNDGHFETHNSGWDAYFNATPGYPTEEVLSNTHVTRAKDTGASLVWSTRSDDTLRLASVGVDYREISGSDTGTIYDDVYGSATGTPGAFLRTDVGSGRQRYAGIFGQVDLFPAAGLELLGSVRAQYIRNDRGFDGIGPEGGLGNLPDTTLHSVDPRLSLRYAIAPEIALRAAAYTAFNAPNLDQLHRSFGVSGGLFLPNPDLRPERLTGAEIGVDFSWSHVSTQVTLFENRVRDLITSVPLTPEQLAFYGVFFGTQWANAGKARSRGLELDNSVSITPALQARVAFYYTDAKIEESPDPAAVGQPLAYLPKTQATIGLNYDDRGLQASLLGRWIGSSIGVQGDPTFFESNGWGVQQDSHFTVDASIGIALNANLSLFLQGVNLFDRNYIADNSGFTAPLRGTPRSFFAGVRARLH
jgi:outer membrane receptor protein involved in Fe transport